MNALAELATHGVYGLKPHFQDFLRPAARALAKAGIRANHVTVAACLGSVMLGVFLAATAGSRRLFLLLPLFLFARMALNALDGMLAREFDQKTHLGAYLNELGDLVSDVFCYLPFAFLPAFRPTWVATVIGLALVAEMAGALGPLVKAARRFDGPMGKSDRALVFGALAFWLGIGGPLPPWAALMVTGVIAILLGVTIVNRVSRGVAEVAKPAPPFDLAPGKARYVQHRFFESHDGMRLFYRYWPATEGPGERAVILLHRGHEHSGRVAHVVDELNLPGFAMFAWDARGHGHSALPAGEEPSLGTFVKDLERFIAHISHSYGIPSANIAIVSQSVGSVLAATWVHDYAPDIRCMVLAAPAFKVKLYVPFARTVLRWMHRIFGDFHVNSYVRPGALTHDPERIASYKKDRFITRPISVRVLLGLYGTSDRIVRDAQSIRVPTQVLLAGSDWVVRSQPQLEFFARLGSAVKEQHTFEGFYHDLLGEKNRHVAMQKVRDFILRAFAAEPASGTLVESDGVANRADFNALCRPLPLLSPKRLVYALTKFGMHTGGRLSEGIRLGLATGFDSGSSLDYVYRNQASGLTPLGRFIDRCYLDSTGWRGIRQRKENVVRAVRCAIAQLNGSGSAVRILDVAAGHGRYVLDAIAPHAASIEDVLLRDYCVQNVALGTRLAYERRLDTLVRFEQGDAFDRASLAAIVPKRTLGVVSGLYELFPENEPVRASLAGLADSIVAGGFLVYTCQPFHPQLELIARTLPNREQRPWIMRCRPQAEMDQLVADAGFRKLEQWIDDEGIFSVSIARKVA